MTPIKPGTATKLGLRKPQLTSLTETLRRAHRRLVSAEVVTSSNDPVPRVVNLYQWRAFENGFPLEWFTTDEDLVVYSKPTRVGAMLLDQNGNGLLGQYRW